MPVVTVQNEALQFEVPEDTNLLEALRKQKISPWGMVSRFLPFLFPCSGDVLVIDGKKNLSVPTEREKSVLGKRIDGNFRLASEASVMGDIEIHTHARFKL